MFTIKPTPRPLTRRVANLCATLVFGLAAAGAGAAGLKGVNLSGAEYNPDMLNAVINFDYTYPSKTEIDYYKAKGMSVIRLPFSGKRLQPVNNGALNAVELARMQETITYCASKGIRVILDPHDYGRKYDSASGTMKLLGVAGGLPASHFANFWSRIATAFRSQPTVIFGLMNEPYLQTAAEWKAVAVAAVTAIRATGATNKILIPGTLWSGGQSWVARGNADIWKGFKDPGNNFAFDIHQYLDLGGSGTIPTCVAGKGKSVLNDATLWARTNGYKLFLGETGWATNATCLQEGAALMNFTSANPDVWIGWTYWAGGTWWPKTYMFRLAPLSLASPVDQPQMRALLNNL